MSCGNCCGKMYPWNVKWNNSTSREFSQHKNQSTFGHWCAHRHLGGTGTESFALFPETPKIQATGCAAVVDRATALCGFYGVHVFAVYGWSSHRQPLTCSSLIMNASALANPYTASLVSQRAALVCSFSKLWSTRDKRVCCSYNTAGHNASFIW